MSERAQAKILRKGRFSPDQYLLQTLGAYFFIQEKKIMTTKLNLQAFLLRIEELYEDFREADLSDVDGWAEFDIVRDGLDSAQVAIRNMLRDIEEDDNENVN